MDLEWIGIGAGVSAVAFLMTMAICYAGETVVRFAFWATDHWSRGD